MAASTSSWLTASGACAEVDCDDDPLGGLVADDNGAATAEVATGFLSGIPN
jgi:hypothetical protein